MAQIIDSYSENNQDNNFALYANGATQLGQSFTGDGRTLDSVKLYLKKVNSPTGTINVVIYAHTGTFGVDGVPTGSILATSANINSADLSTDYGLITFTFSGAEKITLTNGTKYFLVLLGTSITGGGSDYVALGEDSSSATHGGNICSYYSSAWHAIFAATDDLCFYVYGDDISSPSVSISLSPSVSASLSLSPSSSISPSPSVSISPSFSPSISISLSPSASISPSLSVSLSSSSTPSISVSSTPSVSASISVSLSNSPSPSPQPPFFGLKIAKSGFDVLNETDPNNLIFSSDYNTLKYYTSGSITHSVNEADGTLYRTKEYITHDLNFYPYFEVYCKDDLMSGWQPVGKWQAGAGAYRSFYAYVTKTKLYVVADGYTGIGGAGEAYDVVFKYKIFRNNLGL